MGVAYVALGANLGDRATTLRTALEKLGRAGEVKAVSSFYETDPVDYADQPAFLNAVARVRTELSPRELLNTMLQIEAELGRVRTFANAPRTLDLDLLLYDDVILVEDGLLVPHPRLHERGFVLVPLSEIGAEVVHPVLHRTVADLLRDLGDTSGVRPWIP